MRKIVLLLISVYIFTLVGCSKADTAVPVNDSTVSDTDSAIPVTNSIVSDTASTTPAVGSTVPAADNSNSEKRIVCFGTSLTEGTGGNGVTMPNVLERLSGATVLNYGGYAENTNEIATRSGASKFTVREDFPVPSDTESPSSIKFSTEFGEIPLILAYTDAGLNPVTIDGILGNLSRYVDEDNNITYYFKRLDPGDSIDIRAGAEIIPYSATDKRPDDICIFETGGNDGMQSSEDIQILIKKIDKMIEFSGSDKFIVVSELNQHERVPVTDEVNELFEDHYKEHFLNFRNYLMTDAFSDIGLSPSQDDLNDTSDLEIPRYFRSDDVHGNSIYYYLFGQQVYKKCQELGYLK